MYFIIKEKYDWINENYQVGWFVKEIKNDGEVCGICKNMSKAKMFDLSEDEVKKTIKSAKSKGYSIEWYVDEEQKKKLDAKKKKEEAKAKKKKPARRKK